MKLLRSEITTHEKYGLVTVPVSQQKTGRRSILTAKSRAKKKKKKKRRESERQAVTKRFDKNLLKCQDDFQSQGKA